MIENNKEKYIIQELEYEIPYHHLVNFKKFSGALIMSWPFEYYSYVSCIIKKLGELKFDSLIDVGCGDGKFIYELSDKFKDKKLLGIDTSERAIFFAKAFSYSKQNAKFENIRVENVTDKFGIATCSEVFEHIPDEEIFSFQKSIANTLNEDGVLIVTVPSTNIPLNTKHYRHYDINILKEQLQNFELIEYKYIHKTNSISTFLNRLQRKLSSINFIVNLIFKIQNKYFYFGTELDGSHIFAIFKKSRTY